MPPSKHYQASARMPKDVVASRAGRTSAPKSIVVKVGLRSGHVETACVAGVAAKSNVSVWL
ncbi:hypothetical protein M3J09_012886 [Ascochyta lentis]